MFGGKCCLKTVVLVVLVLGVGVWWDVGRLVRPPGHPFMLLSGDRPSSPQLLSRPLPHRWSPTSTLTPSNSNIIFVETSCAFRKELSPPSGLKLNPRQACAIYSTARTNPHANIYLFYTCPLNEDLYPQREAEIVLGERNVEVVSIGEDPGLWFAGSPLQGFEHLLSRSSHPIEHTSDALRILLLWRYGGTYFDLDFVIFKSLEGLGNDWATAESKDWLTSAAFSLEAGSVLGSRILASMWLNYQPSQWASIGPVLITQLFRSSCNLPANLSRGYDSNACGFRVLPQWMFHPLEHFRWQEYFKEGGKAEVGAAYGAHLWNKLSKGTHPHAGSPYALFARRHCAPIYTADPSNF